MIINTHIKIALTIKLRLEQALKQAGIKDPATVTHLTIEGLLTSKDFCYIREKMANTLRKIDMRKTSVEDNVIGGSAFYQCVAFTSVILPETITKIRSGAFSGCENLTSITIPASVTKCDEKFHGNPSLTNINVHRDNPAYTSHDGVLFNKDKSRLISFPEGKIGDYIIPNSVKVIGGWAFEDCVNLTSVSIPNSVTSIKGYAFTGCSGLTLVTIPETMTKIPDKAFYNCEGLTSVTIPASITHIGDEAFYGCTALTSVIIPDSVVEIGNLTFCCCESLKSVFIPKSVKKMDGVVFYQCPAKVVVDSDNDVYVSEGEVVRKKEKFL